MENTIRESLLDKKLKAKNDGGIHCGLCVGYRKPGVDDDLCLEISNLAFRQGLPDCCTNSLIYEFEE